MTFIKIRKNKVHKIISIGSSSGRNAGISTSDYFEGDRRIKIVVVKNIVVFLQNVTLSHIKS